MRAWRGGWRGERAEVVPSVVVVVVKKKTLLSFAFLVCAGVWCACLARLLVFLVFFGWICFEGPSWLTNGACFQR